MVDAILEKPAARLLLTTSAEVRARKGVGSMVFGAVLLVIGFTSRACACRGARW